MPGCPSISFEKQNTSLTVTLESIANKHTVHHSKKAVKLQKISWPKKGMVNQMHHCLIWLPSSLSSP